jgi:hypothetical protein
MDLKSSCLVGKGIVLILFLSWEFGMGKQRLILQVKGHPVLSWPETFPVLL